MYDKEMPARVIVGLVVIGILAAGVLLLVSMTSDSRVSSFEECRDKGYPVMPTSPEQCVYNGETFVKRP